MSEPLSSLSEATDAVVEFRDARDWVQYHTPEHLSRALSIEASELEEEFLWKGPEEVQSYVETEKGREAIREEIGDVLIYALLFCERTGIDVLDAISSKLEKNGEKYPVREARGRATLEDGK